MAESTRYNILLWLVWVQIVLLSIALLLIEYTGSGRVWRWNVPFWTLLIGYNLGFLLLPFSRELEKPRLLKWWLRIDFILTILMFIPFYYTLMGCEITYVSSQENYVLYKRGSGLPTTPHVSLGTKSGLFIKHLTDFRVDFWTISDNDWKIDKTKGYMFLQSKGYHYGKSRLFVCPIDSSAYHAHYYIISDIIDSLYYHFKKHYEVMNFVMPDDFSRISYTDNTSVSYFKSDDFWSPTVEFVYTISDDKESPDSVIVRIAEQMDEVIYDNNSIPHYSPTELQRFLNQFLNDR